MKNITTNSNFRTDTSRHIDAIKNLKKARAPFTQPIKSDGLSSLQQETISLMKSRTKSWGFSDSLFEVKRQKLSDNQWKLTVANPKTSEIIMEVEGHGDQVFAHEDNLARMAEALMAQDLKITTKFDE